MHKRWILGAVLLTVAACGKDKTHAVTVTISVTSDGKTPVTSLLADGTTGATITVNTGSYDGTLTLTTSQGQLFEGLVAGTGKTQTLNLNTTGGLAVATLRTCNFQDPAQRPCGGPVNLQAQAGADGLGTAQVEFTCDGPCPIETGMGGAGGSGGSGGSGGAGGSGGTGGTGGMAPNYTLTLKSSRDVVRNEFEVTTITATVLKDGKPATSATGNMTFSVTTDAELVGLSTNPIPAAVSPPNQTPVVVPFMMGAATVNLTGRGVSQKATVEAKFSNATETLDVTLDPGPDVNEIQVKATNPAIVGVNESLKSSLSTITFQLVDEVGGSAAPGLPVRFSVQGDNWADVQPRQARTDKDGSVTVKFTAGGQRIVDAVVAQADRRPSSPAPTVVNGVAHVNVINGSPSQRGFSMSCPVDQYFPSWSCDNDQAKCTIILSDRDGGAADANWPISVQAEAGGMVSQTYMTSATGDVTIIHRVQNPRPDTLKVQGAGKALALVTLLAYTEGEERFENCSPDNGFYNPPMAGDTVCGACGDASCSGEPFSDLSEPFMDNNDNGVFDDGETYVEVRGPDKGGTNGFDLGNGVWDKDTTIWDSVHVLWIRDLSDFEFYSPKDATVTDPSTLPSCRDLHLRILDTNGNCMNPHDTGKVQLAVTTTGAQGSFNYPNSSIKIGNCFDMSPVGDWTRTDKDGKPDPEFGPQDYPVVFDLTPPTPPKLPPTTLNLKATLTYKHNCESPVTVVTAIDCAP